MRPSRVAAAMLGALLACGSVAANPLPGGTAAPGLLSGGLPQPRLVGLSIPFRTAGTLPPRGLEPAGPEASPAAPGLLEPLDREIPGLRQELVRLLQSEIDRELGREGLLARQKYPRDLPFGLSLSAGAGLLLPSKAGRRIEGAPGREEPSQDDTHGAGGAASLSIRWSFRAGLSLVALLSFERYPGRTRDEGLLGTVEYGDMDLWPLLFGLRLSLPLALDPKLWLKQDFSPSLRGLSPFAGLLAGVAYRDAMQVLPGGNYWRAATVFSARFEAGLAYDFGPAGLEFAAAVAYHSEQPEDVWYAEGDSTLVVLVTGALRYSF